MIETVLTSEEAFEILSIDRAAWERTNERYIYPAPPRVGSTRLWRLDELVCLTWFSALTNAGLSRAKACAWCCALRQGLSLLLPPDLLAAYGWEDEYRFKICFARVPEPLSFRQPPPQAAFLFTLPIAEMRARICDKMDRFRATRPGYQFKTLDIDHGMMISIT